MAIARRSAHMNVMVDAAEKAGRALVRDFGEVEHLQVSKKGPGDFVSAADIKSERLIRSILEKGRPAYGFLLEEGGEVKGSDPSCRWIVDPLDGTANFLHGIPHWSVTIALEKDGEIVAGVIYDPIKDELFTAEKGAGAFVNNRRLRVASRTALIDAVVGTYHNDLTSMASYCANFRRLGSACLDLAYVAAGRLDAFWDTRLKPWDMAAGMLMIKESGGTVSDLSGGKIGINDSKIAAANSTLHAELLQRLKDTGDKAKKTAS